MKKIIVILIAIILGLFGYVITEQIVNSNNQNTENQESENKDKVEEKDEQGNVDDSDENQDDTILDSGNTSDNENFDEESKKKIEVNEKLQKYLLPSLIEITNFEYKELSYDLNVINDVKSKYYITWYAMLNDETLSNDFIEGLNENGQYETGSMAIKKQIFANYYYKLFDEILNEKKLLSSNIPYLSIKDDMLYSAVPFLIKPFVLKFVKTEQNGNNYILYIDFITSFVDKENREIDYELLETYENPKILNYDESLVYAKLKIKYTIDNNDYKLKSIIFEQ